MRVLWLVASAVAYRPKSGAYKNRYNGGGWITSAQKVLMANSDITLGVCFQMKGQPRKCVQEGVTYYPIEPQKGVMRTHPWCIVSCSQLYRLEEKRWEYYYGEFRRVIEDFRPDLIHQLFINPEQNIKMGLAAQQVARVRHDRQEIGNRIVEIYKEILGER